MRQLAQGSAGREWVLARGMCAYTTLEGAAVPARKRRGFVEMALARWSPFSDPQSHVEWVGDRAMLWAWSKAQVLSAGGEGETLDPPRRILPESLYRGSPRSDGEDLVTLDEGLEGRVWRGNVLAASHWWPQPPRLQEWNEFRRGAGLPPAESMPEAVSYPLAERAWAATQARGVRETIGQQRKLFGMLGLGIATALLCVLLVSVLALKVSIWQVDNQIAEREQALEKIIDARDRAQADLDGSQAMLALRPPGGQLELLAAAIKAMPGQWQLLSWKMPQSDRLELVALANNPDPRAIVRSWENSGRFNEVTAEIAQGDRRGPAQLPCQTLIEPPLCSQVRG